MSADLVIKYDDRGLRRFENMVKSLAPERVRWAMATALNDAGKKARTQVVRTLAQQSSIPYAVMRKNLRAIHAKPTGTSEMQFSIEATGKPLSLKYFRPREFSGHGHILGGFGVTAKVWGKEQVFQGGFIRSGWRARRIVLGGHVFHRLGENRNPIEPMFGPGVANELVRDQVPKAFEAAFASLPDRLAHLLARELGAAS